MALLRALLVLSLNAAVCMAAQSVLVMRHCVRSPYPTLRSGRGAPGFDSPDNYTRLPFPTDWNASGVAACTSRGSALATTFGHSLASRLEAPVSVWADNVTRNTETADALSDGLGSAYHGPVNVDGALFDPVKNHVCPDLSTDLYNQQIHQQLQAAAKPDSPFHSEWTQHTELLTELQQLVGQGEAPALQSIGTNVSGGYLTGGLYVASEGIIETFMLEAGAALPVAWGGLDGQNRSELYERWLPLRVLYSNINHGGVQIAARNGGPVLWHALSALADQSRGSQVLIGHDLTLDGISSLLGLSWTCGHFPTGATPPLAGLLFRSGGAGVQIVPVCTGFEGETAGDVVLGTAELDGRDVTGAGAGLEQLQEKAKRVLDFGCIR